jgi:phage terminase large subunit-like protein
VSLRLDAVWSPERGRWESPCGRWYFDEAAAKRAVGFFPRYMRHTTGQFSGQPFELLDWQAMLVVRPLFGWKRTADGLRRFRTLFLEIGKKNGKTQLSSGLSALLAFADREPGAQVYAAAASDEQARILWNESAKSMRACPEFLEDAGVEIFKSSIVQPKTESMFKVISSTVGTKHGFNVHGLVVDEFHTQRSRDLYDTLYKGTSARRQPMVILITTAGDDRESICYEEYERAKRVRANPDEDPGFLPVVFEIQGEDDWTLEANWYKANPSLGITKTLDYMRAECKAAQAEPRKRNSFLRLELNVWTESRTVWISPEEWGACRRDDEPRDLAALTGCVGIDLSETRDLTAVVAAFRRPLRGAEEPLEVPIVAADGKPSPSSPTQSLLVDYQVDLLAWFFLPESTLQERVKKDRVPYDVWARDGFLRVTSGTVVDYSVIRSVVLDEILAKYPNIPRVGFDPWNARDFSQQLTADGAPMVEVRPIYANLSSACKLLEALVAARRVTHDGNPVLRWCFANAELQGDNKGNIQPVKPGGESRGRRRIDGVMATVTALSQLMQVEDAGSVYDTRGLLIL